MNGKPAGSFIIALAVLLTAVVSLEAPAAAQSCQPPNVLITLDVSGSMDSDGKWDAAKSAVTTITDKYGQALSTYKVRFGLELFANPDAYQHEHCILFYCYKETHTQVDSCTVNSINVPVADANAAAIQAKLNESQVEPWSATPIRTALEFANTYAALKDGSRQNYVILITDGMESCDVAEGSSCPNCTAAATALNKNGIKTYVVGFGSGVKASQLNDMATAGGTARSGSTKYYNASNKTELEAVLDTIAGQVASGDCTIPGKLGECAKGFKQCINGQITCGAYQPNPLPEDCDGKDNDCDGNIDNNPSTNDPLSRGCAAGCGTGTQTCSVGKWSECAVKGDEPQGQKCATGKTGDCAEGVTHCINGKIVCVGLREPGEELCDAADNDCDGVIDNGVRNACGGCGELPEEVCNGKDDDCDGKTDNGAPEKLCPKAGQRCVNGECASPCNAGECPEGTECKVMEGAPVCVAPCNGVNCEPPQVCDKATGKCVDPCEGVKCDGGLVCRGGACQPEDCHETGCPDGYVCLIGGCLSDPCWNKQCKPAEACKNGQCINSCAFVSCPLWQRCVDGVCVGDKCDGVKCPDGKRCVDGECVDDPCAAKQCPKGMVCENGDCVNDPCNVIKCPEGQACVEGQCGFEEVIDGGVADDSGVSPDTGIPETDGGIIPAKDGGDAGVKPRDGGETDDDGGINPPGRDGSAVVSDTDNASGCSCSSVGL